MFQQQKQLKNKEKNFSKGQKIAAALFLVTEHIAEHDPIRQKLRGYALEFFSVESGKKAHPQLIHILSVAVLCGHISEKNAHIITDEISRFLAQSNDAQLVELLTTPEALPFNKRQVFIKDKEYIKDTISGIYEKDINNVLENKNKRQEDILKYIDTYKSAGIKDISKLFSDISEKTIQRELNTLVQSGKITKRGNKRWSVYMAVSA